MVNCPRALVVDDNHDVAESFARMLTAMGCEVTFLTDPMRAMETLDRIQADVVFLDIGMPQMNGYELARAIRKQYGWDRLRIVAVTGYGSETHRAESRVSGFDAHVLKPVNPALVEAMLRHLFPDSRAGKAG